MSRLFCPPGEQCKFLLHVCSATQFSLSTLARVVGLSERTLRDWKRDKLHASKEVFDMLSRQYHVPLPKIQEVKPEYWSTDQYRNEAITAWKKKYKGKMVGTIEDRRKGGIVAQQRRREDPEKYKKMGVIMRRVFNKPEKNSLLAEFCGIMLGDGTIGHGQCAISLNATADKEYIKRVVNYIQSLFHYTPYEFHDPKDNVVDVVITGVNFTTMLEEFGLKRGNKTVHQVDVPEWIKKSIEFSKACVRGLIDTDGGIFLHKYVSNGKEYHYLKLNFTNASMPLISFVRSVFEKLHFHPKVQGERKLWLYSQNEAIEYLNIVGTSNPRLKKYLLNPGIKWYNTKYKIRGR